MNIQKTRRHILNACIYFFIILRLINYFYVSLTLQVISAFPMLIVALWSLPSMTRATRIVLFALFSVGVGLLLYVKADWQTFLAAFLTNGNLVMLLAAVPMISGPFYYEDYQSELAALAQTRMRNMFGFLVLVSLCTHVLGVIVSIGAVLLIYELMLPFAKLYQADTPFLKSVSRAYASSGFWSPSWASVIVYSAYPNVKWVRIIPVGIGLALLFMAINILLIYLETRKHPDRYQNIQPVAGTVVNKRKLYTMLLLAVIMILAIVVLNVTTGWDLMLVVTIVSILFPLATALAQQHLPAYRTEMRKYYNVQMVKVCNQSALFILAGFLGKALAVSGAGNLLTRMLPPWLVGYPMLMSAAVILMMILPSFVGVHPTATGTAMVAAFSPAALGMTDYTFCLTIIVGWLLTIMLAPFSATGLMLSAATGKSNYYTSVGMNWRFGLVCLVVFCILIGIIGPLLG